MAPEGAPHRFGSRRSRCLSPNVVGFSESPKSGSTAIFWTAVARATAFQNALISISDVGLERRVLKSDGSGRRTPNFTGDTMPVFAIEFKQELHAVAEQTSPSTSSQNPAACRTP